MELGMAACLRFSGSDFLTQQRYLVHAHSPDFRQVSQRQLTSSQTQLQTVLAWHNCQQTQRSYTLYMEGLLHRLQ
jgi:hypothetical protein